jgi:hypothetical protein
MGVVSAMLLAGSKDSASQVILSTSQATAVGVLNRAKALTLAKYAETQDPNQLPCGFGVHFDSAKSSFVIYQDSRVPSGSCETQNHDYIPSDPVIQAIDLDPRVEFVGAPADVVFIAPYLRTRGAGIITLRIKNGNQTAAVQVTAGGSITSL